MFLAMRIAVGTLGILFGFGAIAWSAFPIFVTLLSWGVAPLGGSNSWLPWALALDTMLIIEGILGIVAGRLILRRSPAAVITYFSAAGIALLSIIPGHIFWQGVNAHTSFFLVVVLVPAIIFCAIYSAFGMFAWKNPASGVLI